MTKTNQNFAVDLALSNHLFLLSIFDDSRFSNICTLNTNVWNLINCVNMKKVKSSQAAILVVN